MPEIRHLISGQTVSYNGPFHLADLRSEIDDWFDRFDYDADIVEDKEMVFQDHKECRIVWEAEKDMSDYAAIDMEVTVVLSDLRDVTIETEEGGDIHCQDSDVEMTVDGWIQTDTEGKYEGRPLLYFFRYIGEHMIYKDYVEEYEERLHEHCEDLKREVRRFLNTELSQT